MSVKVRIDGLKELDAALGELGKSTGKNVLRRVLRGAAEPMADQIRATAPVDPDGGGQLRDSAGVGTRLSRNQSRQHRKMFRDDRASVEMFVGVGALPQATLEEFGGPNNSPKGYVRAAWDAHKGPILEHIKTELGTEITKAAERQARKQARLLRRAGGG